MRLILASQSPRRRELLAKITTEFEVIPARGEEILPEGIDPESAVKLLAEQKAAEVFSQNKDAVVIGSDTVVALDGQILGKPGSAQEAEHMLAMLSGRVHRVFTGVCVLSANLKKTVAVSTDVEFYPLSQKEISDYVATGEPMDKAGAYGIQDKGSLIVKGISGDYFSVMGLPVAALSRLLEDFR